MREREKERERDRDRDRDRETETERQRWEGEIQNEVPIQNPSFKRPVCMSVWLEPSFQDFQFQGHLLT